MDMSGNPAYRNGEFTARMLVQQSTGYQQEVMCVRILSFGGHVEFTAKERMFSMT